MTTDYDPIAEQYQRSKQQPWRTCLEAFSLLNLVGDPTGKSVLDLACGEGFYTRQICRRGAARTVGIDLSAGMIELAQQQESSQALGIEYLVSDARTLEVADQFDVVVSAYLLNYARDAAELQSMCQSIARALKPGGRFVTVNSSPLLHFPSAPSFRPYGFETRVTGDWGPGAPIKWIFHLPDGTFEIENYFLCQQTHEAAFRQAGFDEICWHSPQLSPEGMTAQGESYWETFLQHSPIVLIECRKSSHAAP